MESATLTYWGCNSFDGWAAFTSSKPSKPLQLGNMNALQDNPIKLKLLEPGLETRNYVDHKYFCHLEAEKVTNLSYPLVGRSHWTGQRRAQHIYQSVFCCAVVMLETDDSAPDITLNHRCPSTHFLVIAGQAQCAQVAAATCAHLIVNGLSHA